MNIPKSFQAQITFLYVKDMQPAAAFFENIMGFETMDDQGWAKIYRSGCQSYLGIVSGENAFKQPQPESAVLVTLVVDNVPAWYTYLQEQGVKILRGMQDRAGNQVRCFFFEGPGGYAFEIQEFLNPKIAEIFHK